MTRGRGLVSLRILLILALWVVLGEKPALRGQPCGGLDSRIVLSVPTNPSSIYLATYHGLFRSQDAGESWALVLAGEVTAIVADPTNAETLYVAQYSTLLKTSDSGKTWKQLEARGLPLAQRPCPPGFPTNCSAGIDWLVADPSDSSVLFAGIDSIGVYRSSNGGRTWDIALRSWVTRLVFSSANPSIVYLITSLSSPSFQKSVDRGETWTEVTTLPPFPIVFISASPTDPLTLMVITTGGVFRSLDGGISWSDWTNGLPSSSNPQTVYVDTLVFDPIDPDTIYATSEEQGVFSRNSFSDAWGHVEKDRIAISFAVDPRDNTRLYASDGQGIVRSQDRGQTWNDDFHLGSGVGIFSMNPNPVLAGATDSPYVDFLTLIVDGYGFVPGSTVYFDGLPLNTLFLSCTELWATVPASHIATPRAAAIKVVNPSPAGLVSADQPLVIDPQPPLRQPLAGKRATRIIVPRS